MEISQVFTVNGINFDTKAEAMDYIRRPKIAEALTALTGAGNDELVTWLLDNQDSVEDAFESGTIKRVTKAENAKMVKALDAVVESGDKAFAFIIDNVDAFKDSFRWPSVKRMSEEEKALTARNTLIAASGNDELSDWVIANRDAVIAAYSAGIVKREVSDKAKNALADYQAKKKAEKEALEAEKEVA